MHKWLPIRKRSEGGREGWGRQRGRVEEVQYLVLLNLWEGSEDTRRHQLNMFCISEQFLWCWWRREEGRRGGGGHHPVSHPVCSFHQSELSVWSNLSSSASHKCKKQRLHTVSKHRYFGALLQKTQRRKKSLQFYLCAPLLQQTVMLELLDFLMLSESLQQQGREK